MPIHYCAPVTRSFKPALPSRHLMFTRHSSSMLSNRQGLRGFLLALVLDKPSSMIIESLVARFGGSAIKNSSPLKQTYVTLMNHMPPEHEAVYREVVSRVCKETCKFPMGYGFAGLSSKKTAVVLRFKLPCEVQSILREMSTALPSVEGIKICHELKVPVWSVASTDTPLAAATHELQAFKDALGATHAMGVQLGLARGLRLIDKAKPEIHNTIPFIISPRLLYKPLPEDPKDLDRISIQQLSPTPEIPSQDN